MRPPPPCLPAATSRKWHSRRLLDPLGYLRVRTLANPSWNRDPAWLVRWLRRETPAVDDPRRGLYDEAVSAVLRYPKTRDGEVNADRAWDEALGAIDDILERRQEEHLEAVREAGVSGKDVPPPKGRLGGP
jgi:hypothetical protein